MSWWFKLYVGKAAGPRGVFYVLRTDVLRHVQRWS